MGSDLFEVTINIVKIIAIFMLMVQMVPILVWVERRGSAFIQNRFGPNRVGPLGLTQLLADAVKFVFKEEFVPGKGKKLFFYMAPVVGLIPGALAFAALPLGVPMNIEAFSCDITLFGQQILGPTCGPYVFHMQGYNIGVGIVFVLGVSSLAAYALLLAGWGSSNKYSMFGALRACAQVISYELAMGLSLVGVIILYGTFDFSKMIEAQSDFFSLRNSWGLFYQPLGALLFFAATFAETNRLPFDLPEAESELVAGYHTEYGGMKMLMFFLGEYGHMMVASALMVIFYFGGYYIPGVSIDMIREVFFGFGLSANMVAVSVSLTCFLIMFTKIIFFLWVFIWVRWTLPRLRYDKLMDLGWKTMLPWALFNTVATMIVVFFVRS